MPKNVLVSKEQEKEDVVKITVQDIVDRLNNSEKPTVIAQDLELSNMELNSFIEQNIIAKTVYSAKDR